MLWACQRHLDDLEHGHERGLWFDTDEAADALAFFSLLRHFEGPLGAGAGAPFVAEPWQEFVLGSLFGWKRSDGTRRYREAWVEVARKNGKSFVAAGVGNKLLVIDGEPGAQIYSVATKREQARIIHRAAIAQRDKSPSLRAVIKKRRDRLYVLSTRSFFGPLGRDSHTEDGLNPHGAILDEVHAYSDGAMWDVLESGMGARSQPLIFATTTAGRGAASFGRTQHLYYRSLVDPDAGVTNDAAFVYIAELDDGDDPYDERNWPKANPNIDVSVNRQYLRDRAAKAKQHPRFEVDFLVKNLNFWVQNEKRWISSDAWDACRSPLPPKAFRESLRGRVCYAALDLSSTTDLTALVLYFPPSSKQRAAVLPFFFVPAANVDERAKRDRVAYPQWIDAGFIEATPGGSVDQDHVKRRLRDRAREFQLARQPVTLDPKFAEKLKGELETEHFIVRPFGQGYSAYSAPTKEFERMVLAGELEHDGNPVLRWCVGNTVVKEGDQGELMPSKKRSPERIDGTVGTIMAIGTAGLSPAPAPPPPATPHVLPSKRGGGRRAMLNVFQ